MKYFTTSNHIYWGLFITVIGDFGVGIKNESDREQRQIAEALEQAVDHHDVRLILTTGDNIYRIAT
jgi:hypothetical protein